MLCEPAATPMRPIVRVTTLALIASHLAVASAPCPTASSPQIAAHTAAAVSLAAAPAAGGAPCPGHDASAEREPSTWFDERCPCGCDAAAPGGVNARTGPALWLARVELVRASDRLDTAAPTARLEWIALAPPEPVPLPIA